MTKRLRTQTHTHLHHVIIQRAPRVVGEHPGHFVQHRQGERQGNVALVVGDGPAVVVTPFQQNEGGEGAHAVACVGRACDAGAAYFLV